MDLCSTLANLDVETVLNSTSRSQRVCIAQKVVQEVLVTISSQFQLCQIQRAHQRQLSTIYGVRIEEELDRYRYAFLFELCLSLIACENPTADEGGRLATMETRNSSRRIAATKPNCSRRMPKTSMMESSREYSHLC